MNTTTPLRRDRTELDARDEEILFERVTRRAHIRGPRVGDYIFMKNGDVRRFTHDHGDRLQVTVDDEPGSFYLAANGKLDYSGGLASAIKKTALSERSGICEGPAWFFSHDLHRAHNGVAVLVPCRVYEEAVA